jgi:hypothetical protein
MEAEEEGVATKLLHYTTNTVPRCLPAGHSPILPGKWVFSHSAYLQTSVPS